MVAAGSHYGPAEIAAGAEGAKRQGLIGLGGAIVGTGEQSHPDAVGRDPQGTVKPISGLGRSGVSRRLPTVAVMKHSRTSAERQAEQ